MDLYVLAGQWSDEYGYHYIVTCNRSCSACDVCTVRVNGRAVISKGLIR